jgi:predicted site-specific integrase-resolvase
VVLVRGDDELDKWVNAKLEDVCEEKGREIEVISGHDAWADEAIDDLLSILKRDGEGGT